MPKLVTMVKDGQEAQVVESAFEGVWKHKGWSLKGEPVAAAPAEVVVEEDDEEEFATDE